MTGYRAPSPPPTTRLELRTHDPKRLRKAMFIWLGGTMAAIVAFSFSSSFLARDSTPLVVALGGGVLGLGSIAVLLWGIRRLWELRFYLEIGDARVRLLLPSGDAVADTSSGALTFTKVTYTRHGRHGSSWTRPGFRMRHPGGDHLVGILMPPAPLWPEGQVVPHDGGMPEFELRPADFATLRERVAEGS